MISAGSVVAVVGARFDDDGYDKFRRAQTAARRDAATPIKGELAGEFDSTGFDQFRGELDKSERAADDFAGKVGGSFDKLKLGVAAGAAAIGAVLVKGLGDALEGDELNRKLGVQLGASTKESARLGKIAGKVYAGNYGESLGEVNTAIASVMQNVDGMAGASSKRLQNFTGDILSVSKAFDVDLGGATKAVGQLMRTGLAKDSQEALNIITKGLQNGANASDDFLDTLNEYGTQFRKVGLDGQTATGLISQGLKAGARDSDIVADAIKEFSIRALDGSATTKQGFEEIGLSADKMSEQIAKGGKPAAAGLDTVLDKLRGIEDPVKRAQAATKLFGTQAEDLGAALFALDPSKAAKGIGDVGGAARKANGDLTGAKGQIDSLKRTITIWVQEMVAKALPTIGRMAEKVRGFVEGIRDGTGAGGRFADKVKEIGDRFADAYKFVKRNADLFELLAGILASVVAGFAAFRVITGIIALWRGLTGAVVLFNLAVAANPIVAVIAVLVALGAGLVLLYKKSETARTIMDAVFNGIKDTVTSFVDVYLGMITTVLGGFQKLAEVAGKLPGVGGKFKALAEDIGNVRGSIDGFREGLRKGDDASSDSRAEAERQRKKIKDLADGYDDARSRQSKLKKGTDDYKDAARDARSKAKALAGAIADQGTEATNARKPTRQLTDNIKGLGDAATTTTELVVDDLMATLKSMGAKPLDIKVTRRGSSGVFGTPDIGGLPQKWGGGIANAAGSAADDHVLVGPDGQPKALMSGTEGIVNRPQMGIIDAALGIASAVTGGGIPGGLGELWGMGLRHFAGGGALQLPSGFSPTHQTAGLAGYPAVDVFASPGTTVLSPVAGKVARFSGQAGGPGGGGAFGYSMYIDGANGRSYYLTHMGSRSVRVGQTIRRGQPIGTVVDYPGGVPDHIHEGIHGGLTGIDTSAGIVDVPTLKSPKVSDRGPLGQIVSAVGKRLTSAANAYVAKQSPVSMGAADPGGAGHWSKARIASLWRSVNKGNGDPNLMAAISLAESAGDPSVVNSIGAGGLWQINPPEPDYLNPITNARIAGRKLKTQGLRAWEAFTNGSFKRFLNGGGLLRGLSGLIPRFNGGGNISSTRSGSVTPKGSTAGRNPYDGISALRKTQGDRIGDFDDVLGDLDGLQKTYGLRDRKFGQSTEVLINPTTGAVDEKQVNKRVMELLELLALRRRMVARLETAKKIAERVIKTYTTIIGRLTRSLKYAKKKDRSGIRKSIASYRTNLGEWRGKLGDTGYDLAGARLDRDDILGEIAEVKGTKAEDRTGDDPASADTTTADVGVPDPGDATPATPEPDVDQVARADRAEADAAALRQDLAGVRANVVALTSPGDIGAGGSSAWNVASGRGPGDPGGGPGIAGGGAGNVYVEVRSFVPPTGAELARLGQAAAAGLGANPSVPNSVERVG